MKTVRLLVVSSVAAVALAALAVVAVAAPSSVGLAASGAAAKQYCPKGEKAQRQATLKRFQKQMVPARQAYFKTTRDAKKRAAFVKKQQAQLKVLVAALAKCG
ncbi:MAG TPA: hypothetical protein VM204_04590 [Gaiellaceae bacterium]|nr:hypothetical protein [Gaiellaceae bacterium]